MKKRDNSKDSIVDGLEDAETIGGVSKEEFYQLTFCCKSSYLLNEFPPEPLNFNTVKFPKINRQFS